MDLQSIKTKLIHTVNTLGQSDGDIQPDWAGGPQPLGPTGGPGQAPRPGVNYSAAVDALQLRAAQAAPSSGMGLPRPVAAGASASAAGYLQQLTAMAEKINRLSAEQERAIAEIHTLQVRLSRPSPNGQGQPIVPPSLDLSRAALAAAAIDPRGNISLSYRTPTAGRIAQPPQAMHEGDHLAAHLRTTYGPVAPPSSPWRAMVTDLLGLAQEPAQLLTQMGRAVWELTLGLAHLAQSSSSQTQGRRSGPSHPSLSLADAVLWFGGGVIGRIALNLLLAAFPALWSVAVAAMTAMTAYALYRATLAPRLAFGPAIRVFLLVVGLVVGGQI
ncbi:MAG TPA: hypothetical protein VLS96_09360 [Nodosilinea sp.]|nr:hypothetical protein [Nodosilinea sp.]